MSEPQIKKTRYLTEYHYGMGSIWRDIAATSRDELNRQFPQLQIHDPVPEVVQRAIADGLITPLSVDCEDLDDHFLNELRKQSA